MAKIIEFYIPQKFQKRMKWVPQFQSGKVVEFPSRMTRSAGQEAAAVGGINNLESKNESGKEISYGAK